jgi:hypothetical protein
MRRLRRMFFKARSKQNLNCQDLFIYVQWAAKKISHHLNVSVKKALITHLDFDVTQK